MRMIECPNCHVSKRVQAFPVIDNPNDWCLRCINDKKRRAELRETATVRNVAMPSSERELRRVLLYHFFVGDQMIGNGRSIKRCQTCIVAQNAHISITIPGSSYELQAERALQFLVTGAIPKGAVERKGRGGSVAA